MRILLTFTFCLIAGQQDCAEVTGYKGGSALFNFRYDYLKYKNHTKYFCKLESKRCTAKILSNTTADPDGKIFFMNVTPDMPGMYSVMIKNISQQDGGTYRCGVDKQGAQFTNVTLTVKEDACCGKSLSQTAYLGKAVTFTCTYPEEYKYFFKYLYKVTDHSLYAIVYTLGESAQNGRISLFDHPQKNLFNVNISDVMKEDGGLYMCGFQGTKDRSTNPYFSLVNEIHLEVSGLKDFSIIIITVSVCVVLLLIGGLVLIYKLKHKKTEAGPPNMPTRTNNPTKGDYENDLPGNHQNIINIHSLYQSLDPSTNQSDSLYQSLDTNINQSDTLYESLDPSTNQSDSLYESLDPRTNQFDTVCHGLNRNI
ncbi:polymeric immunoglobulin receptor-like isoform X1 [Salminus brasiliensis]|uniref:polymeric immunoglobulin receptor-like isoform X1 n=1 Tax=Salminus brasiliensis TaxID=930266 RepID=UPI003B838817